MFIGYTSGEVVEELTEVETLVPQKVHLLKKYIFIQIIGGTEVFTSKKLTSFTVLKHGNKKVNLEV